MPLPKGGDARTGPLPLHPMTVGDILDGSFKVFKANARTLLLVTAVFVVPVQLIAAFVLRSQFDIGVLTVIRDPSVAETMSDETEPTQAVLTILTAIGSALVTPFIAGAVSRVVGASYLGREIGPAEALRSARGRFGALLAAFLLVHLLELVGFLLCFLPALAVMAMFAMTAPAIAIEEIGGVAGMRRSWRLAKRRFWPVLGICLLTGFIANMLGQILGTAPAIVGVFLGGGFAWLAIALSGVLSQLVTLPIVTIAAVLLYFDARIRHEGFDLQVIAADLARTPAGGPAERGFA